MRKHLRVALIAACILVGLVSAVALLLFPHTNPYVIHAKTLVIGPRLVYGPLAYDDAKWEVVLRGVRSGEPAWLHVAVDLKPALDTHPGEEMLGAVSTVVDTNPLGAVQILVPQYGAELVCGQGEDGLAIDQNRAERRVRLVQTVGGPQREGCLKILRRLFKNEVSG